MNTLSERLETDVREDEREGLGLGDEAKWFCSILLSVSDWETVSCSELSCA